MNPYIIAGITVSLLLFAVYSYYKTLVARAWKKPVEEEPKAWWKYLIYYDPADPRTIVPKRIGIGVTLNFARPFAKVFAAALIILIIYHLLVSVIKHFT
jgi:uncharacterized membrane protein